MEDVALSQVSEGRDLGRIIDASEEDKETTVRRRKTKEKKKHIVRKSSSQKVKKKKEIIIKAAPKCISCGQNVLPATVEGFEAHSKVCPKGEECWQYAAVQNGENPSSLVDKAIELRHAGLRGIVVGLRFHRFRRWLPPLHVILFDSGREDTIQLATTEVSNDQQQFRFLTESEDAERRALNQKRLELELEAARQYAADLEQDQITKNDQVSKIQAQLEESTLCAVCLDQPKSTALVPCGHRLCSLCAHKFQQQLYPCPVCRRQVQSTLRVYN